MNMNQELIAKVKKAASAEEILALAEENGVEMDENGAKELFERINATGELSDDELDSAAGGGCYTEKPGDITSNCWNGKFVPRLPSLPSRRFVSAKCLDCLYWDTNYPNCCKMSK